MNIRIINVAILAIGLQASAATPLINVSEVPLCVFDEAYKTDRYSIKADTVSDAAVISRLRAVAMDEFMKLDPEIQRQEYDYAPEYVPFEINTFLHYPSLHFYCAQISLLHGMQSWCFDDNTYRFIGTMPTPILANRLGILISQIYQDCDTPLDLKFYCRKGDRIELTSGFMCPGYGVPFEVATTPDGSFCIGPTELFSTYQCLYIEIPQPR